MSGRRSNSGRSRLKLASLVLLSQLIAVVSAPILTPLVTKTIHVSPLSPWSIVKRHQFDTGSTAVQLLRACARIKQLKDHLAAHKKDHVTARSLHALEEQRFSLLAYLKRTEPAKYQIVLEQCFTPKELRILANDKRRKYLP